jgi:uncharacterized protein (DUF3820 family)
MQCRDSEYERWYVRMTVPEGGVGGLIGVAEQLDVRAVAPKVDCAKGIDLLSSG